MSDFTLSYPEPKNEAEYRTVMELLRTEMEALNQKMAENRKDIEQLEAESDVIKKETEQLKRETRAILAELGGAFWAMWKDFLEFSKQIIGLTRKMQQHEEDSKPYDRRQKNCAKNCAT